MCACQCRLTAAERVASQSLSTSLESRSIAASRRRLPAADHRRSAQWRSRRRTPVCAVAAAAPPGGPQCWFPGQNIGSRLLSRARSIAVCSPGRRLALCFSAELEFRCISRRARLTEWQARLGCPRLAALLATGSQERQGAARRYHAHRGAGISATCVRPRLPCSVSCLGCRSTATMLSPTSHRPLLLGGTS